MAKPAGLTERLLAQVWGRGLAGGHFRTTEGQPLDVLHPGWANGDRGPDFKGALLALEGRRVGGDVEIHLRSSQWRAHGHHRDSSYNEVVLQVVWQGDARGPVRLQSGSPVPVLALEPYLPGSIDELQRRALAPTRAPCSEVSRLWDGGRLGALLDSLGRERFLAKARRFSSDAIEATEPGQLLYESLMGALGYSHNQGPFLELARGLPLDSLMTAIGGLPQRHALPALESLLIGGAGLLPSQRRACRGRDDPYAALLEELWREHGSKPALGEADWRFFRVRPDNLPGRRLAAAARLLLRYRQEGLLAGMGRCLERALAAGNPRSLEPWLMVSDEGYWAGHYDFGLPASLSSTGRAGARSPSLLGRGRAAEIAVNIILPFFWALSERATPSDRPASSYGAAREDIASLYCRYPRLDDNHVTRHMAMMLWGGARWPLLNSACRQQALLHLYKEFCMQHRCPSCPLQPEIPSPAKPAPLESFRQRWSGLGAP